MLAKPARARHDTVAWPLVWAYGALILYASLFPFTGWRWPPGQTLGALLALPWPPWRDHFDVWANLLGYLPGGSLLMAALLARGQSARSALLVVLMVSAGLSFATEFTQNFLPGRHPSLKDLAANMAGSAVGALLLLATNRVGLTGRSSQLDRPWFVVQSSGTLALLALWPVGLLFPAPVPLGLGQVGERLRETALGWLLDVPWAEPLYEALSTQADTPVRLGALSEGLVTGLGLLAPCMLAYSIAIPSWRRLPLALVCAAAAVAGLALSTLLNFGPLHAMAWSTPTSVVALAAACGVSVVLFAVPRRVAAGLALAALAGGVALVAQAPDDPYFAQNLQSWELGRFVHFHGIAQWVGWLWPYAAMAWLLAQMGRRE